jgi:TIR domain
LNSAVRTFQAVPRWPGAGEQFGAGWDWLFTVDSVLEVLVSRDPVGEEADRIVADALVRVCEGARVDLVAVLGVRPVDASPGAGPTFELQRLVSALGAMPEPAELAIPPGHPVGARVATVLRDLAPATFAVEAALAPGGDVLAPVGWVVALGHAEGADEDNAMSRARAVLEQAGWVLTLLLSRDPMGFRRGFTGGRWTRLREEELRLCETALARSRRSEPAPLAPPAQPLPSPAPAAPASRPVDENVQFTVYRPRRIPPDSWCPVLAFAHLAERRPEAPEDAPDPVEEVRRQAQQVLGDSAAGYADTTQDSGEAIPREGEITFLLEAPDLQVNPRQRSFRWLEDVHREEFRIRAGKMLDGRTVRGALQVYLGALLVAEVSLAIRVDGAATPVASDTEADRARPYRRIFPSYSHEDEPIVQQVEAYARTMGDEYLRDVTHLRAGEVWNDRLMEFIRAADVFQLFWSRKSMLSPWVRQEWEYALSLGRAHFVRPTYWETPMPEAPERNLPPALLRALHFQRLPVSAEVTGPAGSASGKSTPDRIDGTREPPAHRDERDARGPEIPAPSRSAPRAAPRANPWRIPTALAALLLVGVIGGALMWRQTPTGTPSLPAPVAKAPVQAVSPDGTVVAAMDDEGRIRIFSRDGGDPLVIATTLRPPDVASMRFSPDGSRIVCELRNGTTVQWDARTGSRVAAAARPLPSSA